MRRYPHVLVGEPCDSHVIIRTLISKRVCVVMMGGGGGQKETPSPGLTSQHGYLKAGPVGPVGGPTWQQRGRQWTQAGVQPSDGADQEGNGDWGWGYKLLC